MPSLSLAATSTETSGTDLLIYLLVSYRNSPKSTVRLFSLNSCAASYLPSANITCIESKKFDS